MGIIAPAVHRGNAARKGASPIHFLRILRYARPYRRYLYPALACVVFVAFTYSINIIALLPTIKVMAGEQGIPEWVDQLTVEDRFDIEFAERQPVEEGPAAGGPSLIAVHKSSPLFPEARARDVVVAVNDQRGDAATLLRALVQAPTGQAVKLGLRRPDQGDELFATAAPGPVRIHYRMGQTVASWLPQGAAKRDRMLTLSIIVSGILVIALAGGFCRFLGEYLISLVAGRTVVLMRRRMYERALDLPVSYYATNGTSDMMTRFVQDSQEIYRGLSFVFAKSLMEPLKAVFVFAAALIIDWRITLMAVIAAPIAVVIIRRFGKRIRRANKRLLADYGRMLGALEGALSGIRVVKGYAMERYERRHLHVVDQQILKQQLKIARTEAMSSPLFETVGRVAASIAILYFAHLMFDGAMNFSKFGTLAVCMAGMFDPIRKMSSFYNRMQRANAALDRVFEILDTPAQEPDDKGKPALAPLAERIEFRGVRYTYPGGDRPALDGVNLVVKRGERVAFVGPNGSGKTTLLSLLMRFFDPEAGEILFDGRLVRECSLGSLRRQMSLITQDTVIFADTIANNIAYGDDALLRKIALQRRRPERRFEPASCQQRIEAAARAAYAHDFIVEKPDGYDTYVGEHGVQLSGGQKQRIAIARAILRNAPIFIFDEATSQIDAESEQKIHDAVEKFLLDRTALIIAHRFSTILQADRIVVLDQGRIIDSGRHADLMKRCKLYQSLYGSQIIKDAPHPADESDSADPHGGEARPSPRPRPAGAAPSVSAAREG